MYIFIYIYLYLYIQIHTYIHAHIYVYWQMKMYIPTHIKNKYIPVHASARNREGECHVRREERHEHMLHCTCNMWELLWHAPVQICFRVLCSCKHTLLILRIPPFPCMFCLPFHSSPLPPTPPIA